MHSSLPDKKMTSSRFVPDMNERNFFKNNEVAVSPSTKKSAKFCLTMSVWVFFKLFPLRNKNDKIVNYLVLSIWYVK